jgi:hypothetical protein
MESHGWLKALPNGRVVEERGLTMFLPRYGYGLIWILIKAAKKLMDAKTLIFEASLFDQWEHPSRRFSVKSVPEFLGPCRARPGPREIL